MAPSKLHLPLSVIIPLAVRKMYGERDKEKMSGMKKGIYLSTVNKQKSFQIKVR